MIDEFTAFIETPRTSHRPERINILLERRMKEFLLERRRRLWREGDE
jgi:hypothetical protein